MGGEGLGSDFWVYLYGAVTTREFLVVWSSSWVALGPVGQVFVGSRDFTYRSTGLCGVAACIFMRLMFYFTGRSLMLLPCPP